MLARSAVCELTVFGMLCDDVTDVVFTLSGEYFDKRLSTIETESRQAILVFAVGELGRLFTMADEIYCWSLRLRVGCLCKLEGTLLERFESIPSPFCRVSVDVATGLWADGEEPRHASWLLDIVVVL